MAEIVLGVGTSHSPMLSAPPEMWPQMGEADQRNPMLIDPESGQPVSYAELKASREGRLREPSQALFNEQWTACQAALQRLRESLKRARPDVLIIVSDDQEEMLFEDSMPALQIYWGDSIPMIPRHVPESAPPVVRSWLWGYGDIEMPLPVDSGLAKYLIEYLVENDFDVASSRYLKEGQLYGGTVGPSEDITGLRSTAPRRQGLGHGWTFVVKRLLDNSPIPIVPIMLNTCYLPNAPSARRCVQLGQTLRKALACWNRESRVCIVASGGLSHFVTDEKIDRLALDGMMRKDMLALAGLPKERLISATAELKNWIVCSAACEDLRPELIDYIPVYRSEAGTGGGWAFMHWLPA